MTFLVIDNFFQKFTPFIQNVLPFLCIFLSLFLFLLSFMFLRVKNKKFFNSRLIIGGGAKKGFCPHLHYWGACPGCPPRVYVYALSSFCFVKAASRPTPIRFIDCYMRVC